MTIQLSLTGAYPSRHCLPTCLAKVEEYCGLFGSDYEIVKYASLFAVWVYMPIFIHISDLESSQASRSWTIPSHGKGNKRYCISLILVLKINKQSGEINFSFLFLRYLETKKSSVFGTKVLIFVSYLPRMLLQIVCHESYLNTFCTQQPGNVFRKLHTRQPEFS